MGMKLLCELGFVKCVDDLLLTSSDENAFMLDTISVLP